MFLPAISSAFRNAAAEMIAVPCWSSWKTGIWSRFLSRSSISKHSGDLTSSRLMPPKVGAIRATVSTNSSTPSASTSMSKTSMSAKRLKRTPLPSMTGFAGERADVAQAEHRGAVRDDRDEVPLRRVVVDLLRVLRDRQARLGDARAVGEREVLLRPAGLRRDDLDLPLAPAGVVLERLLGGDPPHQSRPAAEALIPRARRAAAGRRPPPPPSVSDARSCPGARRSRGCRPSTRGRRR